MSKSLAERIGEHTRKVMAVDKDEKMAKNKKMVLDALTNDIKNKANAGMPLFLDEDNKVLRFNLDFVEGMAINEIDDALKDIGFKTYFPSPLYKIVIIIPQHNVSDVILNLVEMYNEILIRFKKSEAEKARQDAEAVIKKLEKEQYEVSGINRVVVSISSQSETLYYLKCISNILSENNLCVDLLVCDEYWEISIPEGSD